MNMLVEHARGEVLWIMPEDVQFVVRGPWLADLVELVTEHPDVGTVATDAQRRVTLASQFQAYLRVKGRRAGLPFRRPHRTYRTSGGMEFYGYGRTLPGVSTGGFSFSRTEIWRKLGPWRTTMDLQLTNDASLGTEDEMLRRYRRSPYRWERFLIRYTPLAEIVTDPRGTVSKVRVGNRRYGKYFPPPDGRFYYRIWEQAELDERFGAIRPAPAFEDLVEPIGFELPLDERGNLKKVSVITEDEPYELIVP
jgi:hypothetical protein